MKPFYLQAFQLHFTNYKIFHAINCSNTGLLHTETLIKKNQKYTLPETLEGFFVILDGNKIIMTDLFRPSLQQKQRPTLPMVIIVSLLMISILKHL